MKEPTNKQQLFINHYIVLGKVKESAKKAGLSYSYCRNLMTQSHIMLKIEQMKEQAKTKAIESTAVTIERVLQEESCIAFIDPLTVFEMQEGVSTSPTELPESIRRAISGYEVKVISSGKLGKNGKKVGGTKIYKYKFCDKGRSLERMGRYLGMYEKDKDSQTDVINIYTDGKVDKGPGLKSPEEVAELKKKFKVVGK